MQVGLTARPGLYVNDQSNACKGSIWNPVEFSRDIYANTEFAIDNTANFAASV